MFSHFNFCKAIARTRFRLVKIIKRNGENAKWPLSASINYTVSLFESKFIIHDNDQNTVSNNSS